jgi:ribosomal protein S16
MAAAAKKTSAIVTPEASSAPLQTPTPEVSPGDLKIEAGQYNRRVLVRMPKDTVADDLRTPGIWRKVQGNRATALIKYDEVLVLGHDESWYARAIVTHATSTEAALAIEKVGTFRPVSEQLYSDGRYRVHWNGASYVVQRVSDEVIVDNVGYSTEAQAIRAIERQYPTVAAY